MTAPPSQAYESLGTWDKPVVQVYSTVPDDVWHINRGITQWNKGEVVHLVRVYAPCEGCITISEAAQPLHDIGDDLWVGFSYPRVLDGTTTMGECEIVMNSDHVVQAPVPLASATHELGHCLGLNHSNAKWSIMGEFAYGMIRPRNHDFRKLEALYADR